MTCHGSSSYIFLLKSKIVAFFSSEKIKIFFLSFYFFFVFGSYTLFKDLKDSLFMITVGARYVPQAKIISLFFMIPLIIFYSWFSQRISRQYLIMLYGLFYGLGSLLISYYILDPEIGLANTVSSQYRIFGWASYLFLEGASPFLVSLSWSFLNSISHPRNVKDSYIIMTLMSKIGGSLFAYFGWFFMTKKCFVFGGYDPDVLLYSLMFAIAACGCLALVLIIFGMSFFVSKNDFIGYNKEGDESIKKKKDSFELFGVSKILKNRYVLGIFGMVFFWEVINLIFNNLRLNAAFESSQSIVQISSFLFQSTIYMHLIGFFFTIFGTSFLVRVLGERVSLMLVPIFIGTIIFSFIFSQNPLLITYVYPLIGAINYSLSKPLRESLFIVTSKSIQFRTKQWIDSFGQKFSKTCGSFYIMFLQYLPKGIVYNFQISFFILLFFLWTLLTYFLGKKWKNAIKNGDVIS